MQPFSLVVQGSCDCVQVSSVCKSNEAQAKSPRPLTVNPQDTQARTLSVLNNLVDVDPCLRKLAAPEPRQKWNLEAHFYVNSFAIP